MSRPVLITHFAPSPWSRPINACNSSGTGGASNSENSVPSKSVEISLITRLPPPRASDTLRENMTPAAQAQYDDAMYQFSMADYAAAADLLKAILADDPGNF